MSILRFEGRDSKNPRRQYLNEVQFQQKFGYSSFWGQEKTLTPVQVEIKK